MAALYETSCSEVKQEQKGGGMTILTTNNALHAIY